MPVYTFTWRDWRPRDNSGPDAIAARIAHIGEIEFAEAHAVLDQEGYLFPNPTPRDVYIEFAANYLEFSLFLPDLLPVYFPAIRDHKGVEAVLAGDVDAKALFVKTRLAGARGPWRGPMKVPTSRPRPASSSCATRGGRRGPATMSAPPSCGPGPHASRRRP